MAELIEHDDMGLLGALPSLQRDAARYRAMRAALLSGGPEWQKLAALLNIAPDTPAGVDDAVDAALGVRASAGEPFPQDTPLPGKDEHAG